MGRDLYYITVGFHGSRMILGGNLGERWYATLIRFSSHSRMGPVTVNSLMMRMRTDWILNNVIKMSVMIRCVHCAVLRPVTFTAGGH